MIDFHLDKADKGYQEKIVVILTALQSRYPQAKLREVCIFDPKPDDKSMGNTVKGVIRLNAFWFSKKPSFLQEAAVKDIIVPVNGKRVSWHGALISEPEHVLTHEFGHVLTDALPNWKEWARPRFKQATMNPETAPSGYALADMDEFFAENFALVDLGLASEARTKDLYEFIVT